MLPVSLLLYVFRHLLLNIISLYAHVIVECRHPFVFCVFLFYEWRGHPFYLLARNAATVVCLFVLLTHLLEGRGSENNNRGTWLFTVLSYNAL